MFLLSLKQVELVSTHPSLEVILPPVTWYLHWNRKQRVNYLSVLKPQCGLLVLAAYLLPRSLHRALAAQAVA